MKIKTTDWPGRIALSAAVTCCPAAQMEKPAAGAVEVSKIWDRGEHNAFTDLIR